MNKRYTIGVTCSLSIIVAISLWLYRSIEAMYSCIGPRLDCPVVIEVGEQEQGQVATTRIVFRNTGDMDLSISKVQTSCSCAGLEIETAGTLRRVSELHIPPAGERVLIARVAVNGIIGEQLRSSIQFDTNIPSRPQVVLNLVVSRIKAGLTITPAPIAFGVAPVGSDLRRVVTIIDCAPISRKPVRVKVRDGAPLKAVLLPLAEQRSVKPDTGVVVGQIEVIVSTDRIASIDEQIDVWFASEQPLSPVSFVVSGRIGGIVEVAPDNVTLPLMSGAGVLYSTACTVYHPLNTPFRLQVQFCPHGWQVTIRDGLLPGTYTVDVELLRNVQQVPQMMGPVVVLLVAHVDGTEIPLQIVLNTRPTG